MQEKTGSVHVVLIVTFALHSSPDEDSTMIKTHIGENVSVMTRIAECLMID
jgi:hypothetical protein